MANTYNLGDLLDLAADAVPDRIAIVYGDDRYTYKELKERSDRLAAALVRRGVKRGMTIGPLMYNCPAYVETLLAALKIGAIPFNINYRYKAEELYYIFNNAQIGALIYDREFEPTVATLASRLPHLHLKIVTHDEQPISESSSALNYQDLIAEPIGDTDIHSGRSEEDRLLLYTGGTTGLPKGVEWSHKAKFYAALGGNGMFNPAGPITAPEQVAERAAVSFPMVNLTLAPLMHGAALWSCLITLLSGYTLILKRARSFSAELAWDLVAKEKVNALAFTGDAMALPLIDAYDAHPDRWDTSSLLAVNWGGAPLAPHLQTAFKQRFPNALQMSGLGSSESGLVGGGNLDTKGDGFMCLPARDDLAVIVDSHRFAEVGETGILARTGYLPSGYWGDPQKTAETFINLADKRWVLTGDQARLNADGSMTLFGRGSTSINTGGEKVFPEEVEAVVRSHPLVRDALIVGVSDARWGETVAAVVALRAGKQLTLEELQEFCRSQLAGYKVPRKLVLQSEILRSPAGKADYKWAKTTAQNA